MRNLLLSLLVLFALAAGAQATDVAIGASTVPGFNAANLPPDVTLTGVTVTFNNPNVTCSNCFRQQWVGLAGFRISIEGVAYTVKHVTSKSALTLTTNYAAGGSSNATVIWYKYVELRIYADSAFQPAGKTYIVQPGAPGSGAWHRRIAASVVNELGVNNLYISEMSGAIALDATTDSPTNQAARYYAAFYRPEGGLIQAYNCFDSFALPPVSPTTWPDICTFNQRQVIVQDDSTYTKTQIDAMRTGCTTGQSLFYAVTGLKPACLNFGAGLQLTGNTLSTTAGSSYTTILSNGSPVTQRQFLNFLAPSFTVADNGGILSTDVNLDGDLNALALNAVNGFWARTGAGTGAARTITGTANRIGVTNGDGVAGNPTLDIGSDVVTLTGTQTLTNKTVRGYPRCIEVNTTATGNVGTGLDSLHSFTLPADSLANDGDYVRVRYAGTFATNDNNKRIAIKFDGQSVHITGFVDIDAGAWAYEVTYVRVSATSVRASSRGLWNVIVVDGAAAVAGNGLVQVDTVTITVANLNSNAVTLLVQGETAVASDNDVVQNMSVIELVQR